VLRFVSFRFVSFRLLIAKDQLKSNGNFFHDRVGYLIMVIGWCMLACVVVGWSTLALCTAARIIREKRKKKSKERVALVQV
jgi:hypothetical protein